MATPRNPRIGDLRSAVRLMRTLDTPPGRTFTGVARKRRLVADLCRMLDPQNPSVGAGGCPNGNGRDVGNRNGHRNGKVRPGTGHNGGPNGNAHPEPADLSPRMRQTLDRLLAGDSEKEIAAHFGRSRHTVHVYVKKLYLRFGVSSRGELFSLFVHARSGDAPR